MSRQVLPTDMQSEFLDVPDWAVNVAFADAMEWLVWKINLNDIQEGEITREWLTAEASKTYNFAHEQWEQS